MDAIKYQNKDHRIQLGLLQVSIKATLCNYALLLKKIYLMLLRRLGIKLMTCLWQKLLDKKYFPNMTTFL